MGDSVSASISVYDSLGQLHLIDLQFANTDIGEWDCTATCEGSSTTGTLTFAAGETQKTIEVPVYGDPYEEGDENFFVEFSDLTGNTDTIVFAMDLGMCTIFDDDVPTTLFEDVFETGANCTVTEGFSF